MASDAESREMVSGLNEIIEHPPGVRDLVGVGINPHISVRSIVNVVANNETVEGTHSGIFPTLL